MANNHNDPFIHQPLQNKDETRVFVLEPGKFDDPLVGTFVNIDLRNPSEYDAISYCWMNCTYFEPLEDYPPDTEVEKALAEVDSHGNICNVTYEKVKYKDLPSHPDEFLRSMYFTNFANRSPGEITCDNKSLVVGGELITALKRFRLEDRPRRLWADAMCIDQNNLDEKAVQIRNMGLIYSSAQEVLIWLGESIMGVWEMFLAVPVLEKKLQEIIDLPDDEADGGFLTRQITFELDPEISGLNWDHMSALLRRAWFSRIWCLQEIVKARKATMCVADIHMPWMRFAMLMQWLRRFNLDQNLLARGEALGTDTVSTMVLLQDRGYESKLLDLLRETRSFKSTLPCDKIFAVLALVPEDERQSVTVDYHLSSEAIYCDFAITQIRKHNSLEILYQCCKSSQVSSLKLPSWVPDWTQPAWHENFSWKGLKTCASLDSRPIFSFSSDQTVLSIRARIVDEVHLIDQVRCIPRSSVPMPELVEADSYKVKREKGLHPFIRAADGQLITGSNHRIANYQRAIASHMWLKESIYNVAFSKGATTAQEFEAVWRTFMCNQTLEGSGLKPGLEWGEYFSSWLAVNMSAPFFHDSEVADMFDDIDRQDLDMDLRGMPGDTPPWRETCRKSSIFCRPNGQWTYNRRFFRSKGNTFGWCPDGVEAGDKIAVVDGLAVPLVLRQVERGYEVCGDVYLHGIMEGEAMTGDIKTEMIDLV